MTREALAGKRVLVVDADDARADAVHRMVTDMGATVAIACALHPALDVLEEADPAFDGVILAERLADADGIVLARAIRTSPLLYDLRLVLLTAGSAPDGIDVACAWPSSAETVCTAIIGPIVHRAEPSENVPVLDVVELESIAGGLTAELVGMLNRFAGQARKMASEAMVAAVNADTEAAQAHGHALKGAAFSAGAMRLGRAAQAFEKAAAVADWDTATSIDLPAEARALATAIQALPEPEA